MSGTDARPRWAWYALAAAALPVLIATLTPGGTVSSDPLAVWCVVCGWRGASDGLLNVALFVPLGMAFGALGLSGRRAVLAGGLLSLAIELAQFFIPNRYPGLGDVLYNGLGAGLGVIVFAHWRGLLTPEDRSHARRRTWSWGMAGLVGLLVQSWLIAPSIPEREHLLEWTPPTRWGSQYEGDVLRLVVDGVELRAGPVESRRLLVDRLLEGATMEVVVRAGPRAPGDVPLVLLTDAEQVQDFFLGLDYDDIVVRYRTNGMRLRLDRPFARWHRGAATWAEGDTVTLRFTGISGGIVLDHDGGSGVPVFPPLPGPVELVVPSARGWGFLLYPRFAARRPDHRLADMFWMSLLALPLGLWGAPRSAAICAVAWIGALLLLPLAVPLLSPSVAGTFGVLAGFPLGLLARYIQGNPKPFRWWEPLHTIYDPDIGEGVLDEDLAREPSKGESQQDDKP